MASLRIKPVKTVIDNAFHGTELRVARKIVAGESFLLSKGPDQYLGDGVYFYEGSLEQAEIWATRRRKFDQWGIVQAEIRLGRCLDLNVREHVTILLLVAEALRKRVSNPNEVTDAAVINYYASEIETQLETVRCAFNGGPKQNPIYVGSRIYRREMIICVRNLSNISKRSLALYGGVPK